ncbi:unnamed protein product [Protopolystoma xenopodis]|uniref:Uncharacterized protein n=1 Tax=Protopolystoma xenopodis TaxID=117903 RepID=A0A3S5FCE1_9PLAT|nr:unnamed protein product [Protopolystoma xenopodis]
MEGSLRPRGVAMLTAIAPDSQYIDMNDPWSGRPQPGDYLVVRLDPSPTFSKALVLLDAFSDPLRRVLFEPSLSPYWLLATSSGSSERASSFSLVRDAVSPSRIDSLAQTISDIPSKMTTDPPSLESHLLSSSDAHWSAPWQRPSLSNLLHRDNQSVFHRIYLPVDLINFSPVLPAVTVVLRAHNCHDATG